MILLKSKLLQLLKSKLKYKWYFITSYSHLPFWHKKFLGGNIYNNASNYLPSFCIILLICSTAKVLRALLKGGPILWGNTTLVSTIVEWRSFTALRSDSKLCPIRISLASILNNSWAWTSLKVVLTPIKSLSLIPLNLQKENEFINFITSLNFNYA